MAGIARTPCYYYVTRFAAPRADPPSRYTVPEHHHRARRLSRAAGGMHADDVPADGDRGAQGGYRAARARGGGDAGQGAQARHGARQAEPRAGGHLAPHARHPEQRLRPHRRGHRLLQLRLLRGHPLGAPPGGRVHRRAARADHRARFFEPEHHAVDPHPLLGEGRARLHAVEQARPREVPVPRPRLRPPLRHHGGPGYREHPRAHDRDRPGHGRGARRA